MFVPEKEEDKGDGASCLLLSIGQFHADVVSLSSLLDGCWIEEERPLFAARRHIRNGQ